MTYIIAEPCIDVLDLSCVSVCPVDCIHYEEGTDRKLFIDPNECIDCGACEPERPVNAIFPEESLPPEWANYTKIDAASITDQAAARAAVDAAKPGESLADGAVIERSAFGSASRMSTPIRDTGIRSAHSCNRRTCNAACMTISGESGRGGPR